MFYSHAKDIKQIRSLEEKFEKQKKGYERNGGKALDEICSEHFHIFEM